MVRGQYAFSSFDVLVSTQTKTLPHSVRADLCGLATVLHGDIGAELLATGPKAVLEERDDPSDQPSKELFLGDTIIGDGGFTRKVHRQHEATAPAPSTGIGAISSISGFQTLDKMGIGGIELEMRYTGAIPKRYGEAQGRHLGPFALGPDEWVQAVLQQSQDKNPRHFGNALTFFTSTGHVHTLRGEGATRLQHLGASRGFQIRELKFQGSRLKEISVAPVDKKGLQEINWWAWGDDVEYARPLVVWSTGTSCIISFATSSLGASYAL
eukprot:s5003_g8.t1